MYELLSAEDNGEDSQWLQKEQISLGIDRIRQKRW